MAIQRFRDEGTADIFHGRFTKKARRALPTALWPTAWRKLDQLNAVARREAMRVPPGNRWEALKDDLDGWDAVRINDKYRIIYRWTDRGPDEVWITDYH